MKPDVLNKFIITLNHSQKLFGQQKLFVVLDTFLHSYFFITPTFSSSLTFTLPDSFKEKNLLCFHRSMLSKCFKDAKASHSELKPSIMLNHVSYLGRYTQHTRTLYRKPGIIAIKREKLWSWHITGVWKVFTLLCFFLKF